MKNNTSRKHRQNREMMLQVDVMSPRIAWLGFIRFLGTLVKLACLLAVLVAIGWGVWRGVRHTFYQNPDFRLQAIDLNPNPVIDEVGVVNVLGIDLADDPSLFEIDVTKAEQALATQPGVVSARIERHLPGTLVVRVTPRVAKAWVASEKADDAGSRPEGALLVDETGVAYPCPELQAEAVASLPLILLPETKEYPIESGSPIRNPLLSRFMSLLDAAQAADPQAVQWIETVRQLNAWSLELRTRLGTKAVFGLGEHPRQMETLRAAIDHAGARGYEIATINLIPKYNIPITIRDGTAPPKAIIINPTDAPDGTHPGQLTESN